MSLGLRQGVYCLRRHLRRLSLCKFRRRAGCVVGKRSVGSRSVAAGRSLTQSAAIFGRTCPQRQEAFPTSLPLRTFLSCAVWPALVCTLEILLGLLTSARRYVLIKVGVAEAPLFTPTHSCLRPLRLLRFILLRKTLSKWQKTVALFLLICYNTQVTSGGPLALLRMNA